MRNTKVNVNETRIPWWAILGGTVGRWLFRHRWALLPFALLAIVPPTGWALAVVAWALSWWYVAGIAALVVVITVTWCAAGLRRGYDRALAGGVVALCGTYAAMIASDPLAWRLLVLWPFALVFAPLWWWGPTIKARVRLDVLRARFARSPLAEDGGHLVDVTDDPAGEQVHVRMGRRWQAKDREHLADVLDVPDGAIIAEPDKRTRLRTVLAKVIGFGSDGKWGGPEIPHPALAAGAMAEGGRWAPRSRSITDGIPLGEYRDRTAGTLHVIGSRGGRHGGVFGKTGSGKSGTISDIVAGVAATFDGAVFGSDASKRGGTLKPWADVLRWPEGQPIDDQGPVPALALNAEDTIRQLQAVLNLVGRRCEAVADSDHDVHVPTAEQPGGVFIIEELAALITDEPDIADLVVQVAQLARQAGIALVFVSQGTDWDSIPTKLRQQLGWRALHRLELDAFRLVAKDLAGRVDMDLFDVPGLLYLSDDEGGSLVPLRAYALYNNGDKRRVAAAYRREVQAGAAGPAPAPAPTQRQEARSMRQSKADARELAQGAVAAAEAATREPVEFGDRTAAEVFASVPADLDPETREEEELTAAIVERLRDGEPASSTKLAEAVGSSPATVLRRLARLRAAGRVQATGAGAGTRWALVAETAGVSQ